MSGFLLDTNIVSLLSPSRTDAPPSFIAWLERMDEAGQVFLSVVTIHEIEKGIALLDLKGATAKAAALRRWLDGLLLAFSDKIISFDAVSAAMAGQLEAKALAAGHDPGMADAMVAGLAQAHDLTIITRNIRHFRPFGVAACTPDEVIA